MGAGDAERRRLERNLHDGAQQRLVSLALQLRLTQSALERRPDAVLGLLEEAQAELARALDELRELARGIHPAILTDRGLGPALEAILARAPLPVELTELPEERLPEQVEAAVYYVVAETITNIAKHAQAESATVSVTLAGTTRARRDHRRRHRRSRSGPRLGPARPRRPHRSARRRPAHREPRRPAARASRRRSPARDAPWPGGAPGYPWCGSVAQGTEQKPSKLPVGGSNPSGPIAREPLG